LKASKLNLPADCPPDIAQPNEITLYRLFVKNEACLENFDYFITTSIENIKFQNPIARTSFYKNIEFLEIYPIPSDFATYNDLIK